MNKTEPGFEETIIKGVKNEFFIQTGKYVRVVKCERWESTANFTFNASIGQIIKMVFDFTKWKWADTFTSATPGSRAINKAGNRTTEKIYRRGLIDYLATNNGCTLSSISIFTNRGDHTTIMNSVRKFEDRLETDSYARQSFMEITDFCKANYYLYKDKSFTKEEIIEGEE